MLGGRHACANTEVHDVVLAIGDTLEEVYPQLKQSWFGEQKGLHIDAWAKINGITFEGIWGTASLCTGRSTEPYDSQTAGEAVFCQTLEKTPYRPCIRY